MNPFKMKVGMHDTVKEIIARYKDIIENLQLAIKSYESALKDKDILIELMKADIDKYKDELNKERATTDYFEKEENWISHTREVAGDKVYTMHDVTHMRKAAFKRQMERRKNL
ncbi:MAG: hypothetical protein PHY47_01290 [Lachnospiraceae bacterium]|nr:hypothetical protein [Lachnospiraceae bacterium]